MEKAQAAMEFLITYGWAIVIITVVIGVLAGLSFRGENTEYCLSKQQGTFTCLSDFLVVNYKGVNYVYLSFIYNGYDTIEITDLACVSKGEDYKLKLLGNAELGRKKVFAGSDKGTISSLNCGENKGDYFEGVVAMKYHKLGSPSYNTALFEIKSKVSSKQ